MRILHVVESFASGTFVIVTTLANGQARRGAEVWVAAGRHWETPVATRAAFDARVGVTELVWDRSNAFDSVATIVRVKRLTSEFRPDVVHLHSSYAGVVGALAVPRRVATVYTPHGYSLNTAPPGSARRVLFRLAERLVASRVNVVAGVSRSEASLAASEVGARRVAAVPNGIAALNRQVARSHDGGKLTVACCGRIGPARNPAACARILRQVGDIADLLWIGGLRDEPDAPSAAILGDAGVAITGWLSRDESVEAIRGATLLLHWPEWDGLPVVVLEAVAAGTMVIGRDVGGIREVIGTIGLCSNESDAVKLIRRLLLDKTERSAMAAEQRRSGGYFNEARMVADWLRLYRCITSPGLVG